MPNASSHERCAQKGQKILVVYIKYHFFRIWYKYSQNISTRECGGNEIELSPTRPTETPRPNSNQWRRLAWHLHLPISLTNTQGNKKEWSTPHFALPPTTKFNWVYRPRTMLHPASAGQWKNDHWSRCHEIFDVLRQPEEIKRDSKCSNISTCRKKFHLMTNS